MQSPVDLVEQPLDKILQDVVEDPLVEVPIDTVQEPKVKSSAKKIQLPLLTDDVPETVEVEESEQLPEVGESTAISDMQVVMSKPEAESVLAEDIQTAKRLSISEHQKDTQIDTLETMIEKTDNASAQLRISTLKSKKEEAKKTKTSVALKEVVDVSPQETVQPEKQKSISPDECSDRKTTRAGLDIQESKQFDEPTIMTDTVSLKAVKVKDELPAKTEITVTSEDKEIKETSATKKEPLAEEMPVLTQTQQEESPIVLSVAGLALKHNRAEDSVEEINDGVLQEFTQPRLQANQKEMIKPMELPDISTAELTGDVIHRQLTENAVNLLSEIQEINMATPEKQPLVDEIEQQNEESQTEPSVAGLALKKDPVNKLAKETTGGVLQEIVQLIPQDDQKETIQTKVLPEMSKAECTAINISQLQQETELIQEPDHEEVQQLGRNDNRTEPVEENVIFSRAKESPMKQQNKKIVDDIGEAPTEEITDAVQELIDDSTANVTTTSRMGIAVTSSSPSMGDYLCRTPSFYH